jgi:rRNA processing protein Krr1/Pno1
MRAQYPQRPFSLTMGEGQQAHIVADPVLVRRALENVLENAHKAEVWLFLADRRSRLVTCGTHA